MIMVRPGALAVIGATLLFGSTTDAFVCRVVTREDTTNYGPGIMLAEHTELTPFAMDSYNAVISYNEAHCVQMCCEQLKCYVAVFDHEEAVCYLKGTGAVHTYDFQDQVGFTAHEMLARTGSAEPIALEPSECSSKRGVAFDFKEADDLVDLALGMSWWYNWSPGIMPSTVKTAQASSGCEYVPMVWGEKDIAATRLANLDDLGTASHLLGFNEPNFNAQASLTAAEAASLWSTVRDEARELGAELVSPAVNFCSGACNEEDPVKWLDDFFAACDRISGGCGVTAIAVHSYTCEARYLNKHLHQYLKYDLPIWLTEFACGEESEKMNEAGQAKYLGEALRLLELHPGVARYAWFTARGGSDMGVAGSDLLSGTGEMTEVGSVFFNTYKDLQRCTVTDAPTDAVANDSTDTPPIAVAGESVGLGDVDTTAAEITNCVIGNLGGTGTYMDVVSMAPGENMVCPDDATVCVQESVSVNGTLSPFDEGVSVAFRGPMNLHNIVWFEGEANSVSRTSSWTPTTSSNLVFMNNLGAADCSGEWTICAGNSQSYSDKDGAACAAAPEQFAGVVPSDQEVNIMSSTECTSVDTCGFYRDVGMEGWKGGDDGTKVMVFEVDMPHCGSEGFSACVFNRPAVWALNSKVVRTAQYGCNCRGAGGNGGCGEFDIIEAVIGGNYADMLFTTVYDFKGTGAPGHDKYFLRPSTPTHFAAIFRGGSDAYLQVVQLTEFDYTETTLSGTFLDSLKEASTENHDIYDVPA